MKKTGKQIQDDVWRMLKDSVLALNLTGSAYKDGTRPRNSRKEDAIVIFTTGIPDEIQKGVVTINIFVPDKDFYGDGMLMEDFKRTEEIESLAARWVEGLTCDQSNYRFKLRQTITTDEEREIHQHFVVVVLEYKYFAGDTDEEPMIETELGDLVEIKPEGLTSGHTILEEKKTTWKPKPKQRKTPAKNLKV